MKTKVFRMSGAGNLFSIIDNRAQIVSESQKSETAQLLCTLNLQNSFAAEGMIYIENSDVCDFKADFFNPDGTSGMMCGNGGRCAVALAHQLGFFERLENITFEMSGVHYRANIIDSQVELFFPKLKIYNNLCPVQIVYDNELTEVDGVFVDNGSQHYCLNIAELGEIDIAKVDLTEVGPRIRNHRVFKPDGANCNLLQIIDNHTLKVRTFERGVEHETGACGTGAIASAYAAENWGVEFPITVFPSSGIPLIVKKIPNGSILEGPAEVLQIDEIEI